MRIGPRLLIIKSCLLWKQILPTDKTNLESNGIPNVEKKLFLNSSIFLILQSKSELLYITFTLLEFVLEKLIHAFFVQSDTA